MSASTVARPHWEVLPRGTCLLLRSAGRAAELNQLTQFAQEHLKLDLAQTGACSFDATSGKTQAFGLRTRPSEIMYFEFAEAGQTGVMHRVKDAIGSSPLLHVVDASHAQTAFALTGASSADLLLRLADATSLPRSAGQATRLRLADLHATLVWESEQRYLMLVDVLYADFLHERLRYAAEALDSTTCAL